MPHQHDKKGGLFSKIAAGCGLVVAGLGIAGLSGWLLGWLFLSSLGKNIIPMAPSSAFLLILMGSALYLHGLFPNTRSMYGVKRVIVIFICIISLTLLFLSLSGHYYDFENLWMVRNKELNHIHLGHMSPLTALCFSFTSLSGLFLIHSRPAQRNKALLAFWLSFPAVCISFVLLIGYSLGVPVMYQAGVIPPALPTSISFFVLGLGIMSGAGIYLWPDEQFEEKVTDPSGYLILSVYILLSAGIVVTGYLFYQRFEKQYTSQIEFQLRSITDSKASELVEWRKERLYDASIYFDNPNLSDRIKKLIQKVNVSEETRRIDTWLRKIYDKKEYESIALVNTDLKPILIYPDSTSSIFTVPKNFLEKAIKTHNIIFQDFYRDSSTNHIFLNLIIPVFDTGVPSRVLGVILLKINPENYVYPLLRNWPLNSQTSETLIVRREGNEVVYLNNTRFGNNPALRLHFPLDRRNLPAAMAVTGKEGIVKGVDYRNTADLAYIKAIPESPWFMVSRIDVGEVNKPLHDRLWMTVLIVVFILLCGGTGIGYVWREEKMRSYLGKIKAADNFRKLNLIYAFQSDINQAIVRIRETKTLYEKVCQIAVEQGKFELVWIAMLDDSSNSLRPAAFAGNSHPYLDHLQISVDEIVSGSRPSTMAIKTGKHCIVNDIENEANMKPWKEEMLQYGYGSSASFPLSVNNKIIGSINLYSREAGFFREDQVRLLEEATMDLSFAIEFNEQEIKRKKAEAEVKEKEERYHTTLEEMMEGCQIIGFDWRYLFVNKVAATHGRASKEEMLGKTMLECYPGIEKTPMFSTLRVCMKSRIPQRMENNFVYPDGSNAWFELYIQPVPEGIFILTLDITEQKNIQLQLQENESILNRAQQVAHLGSWSINLPGQRILWSSETYRIYELENGVEISLEKCLSCVYVGDRDLVTLSNLEAAKGIPYEIQYRLMVKNQIKWVREKALLEYDADGKVKRIIGTTQDITQQKQAEEKIHLLNAELELRIAHRTAQLEDAYKELEGFSYSVSHDLRAPLRSIIGYSKILKDEFAAYLNEEGIRLLNIVINNTHKMGQLIDDILEFSRTGRASMVTNEVNVQEMVKNISDEYLGYETDRKINIKILPLQSCKADPTMLKQVWINLIMNAIKYTRNKEITEIEIGCRVENGNVSYFIKDNGVGFDMKYVDKLFGVFQRLHTSHEFEGTGVGLALVKKIITRHGGRVWAEAKPKQGATFYFSLPKP